MFNPVHGQMSNQNIPDRSAADCDKHSQDDGSEPIHTCACRHHSRYGERNRANDLNHEERHVRRFTRATHATSYCTVGSDAG